VACGDTAGADADAAPDGAPAPLFVEATPAGWPTEVVPVDPDDVACDDPAAPLPCTVRGASFGVGAAAADLDGDGRVDLFLGGPGGGRWLRNVTAAPGAAFAFEPGPGPPDTGYVHGVAAGLVDDDDRVDLVLATATGPRLLVGDGAGGFTVAALPVAAAEPRATSVTLADWNGDGRLDIHVSSYGVPGSAASSSGPGHLYLNRGGGSFEDVAAAWPARHGWASLAADADADGRLDLVLVAERWLDGPDPATTVLFNAGNDGEGRPLFVEVPALTDDLHRFTTPMGAAAADPDEDGRLEIVLTVTGPLVYLDRADGAAERDFVPTSFFSPTLDEALHSTWSPAFLDADRDGRLDAVYVGGAPCAPGFCAAVGIPAHQTHRLVRYEGALGYFGERDLPFAGGLSPPGAGERNGRGLVLADLDGDGRDELVVTPFADAFRVFRSVAAGGHFVRVRLRGGGAGASAPVPCGALVTVTTARGPRARQLTCGGATHSQRDEAVVHVELGPDASGAEVAVRVDWPSGAVQEVLIAPDVPAEIVEPAP
jgi:hypothetical protein